MSHCKLPKSLIKGTKVAKKNYQFSNVCAILPVVGHHRIKSALESLQTYGKRLILSFYDHCWYFSQDFKTGQGVT